MSLPAHIAHAHEVFAACRLASRCCTGLGRDAAGWRVTARVRTAWRRLSSAQRRHKRKLVEARVRRAARLVTQDAVAFDWRRA